MITSNDAARARGQGVALGSLNRSAVIALTIFGIACTANRSTANKLADDAGGLIGQGQDVGPDADAGGTTSGIAADSLGFGADLPCQGRAVGPDGSCCPDGQAWDGAAGCVPIGVPGCTNAATCKPFWCGSWQNSTGGNCSAGDAGCVFSGQACLDKMLQATPAPCQVVEVTAASGCVAVGHRAPGPKDAAWQGDSLILPATATVTAAVDVSALPALPPLSAPEPPQFCQINGQFVPCPAGQSGCAAGSTWTANGACDPAAGVTWTCPQGFDPSSGADLAPCAPSLTACGSDPFAGVADGPGVVFVAAGAAAGGKGTRAAPLADLAAAVDLVPGGGTVVLGAGAYVAQVDTSKTVTIRGVCAAKVTLMGSASAPALRAYGSAAVTLQDVTVQGGRDAVRIEGPAQANLQRVAVGQANRIAIIATGNAKLALADVYVHDTQPAGNDGSLGRAVHGDNGAILSLLRFRATGNRERGLYVDGVGSTATGQELLIDGTQIEKKFGQYGDGLSASTGAQIALEQVRLVGNQTAGALAYGTGSSVSLARVRISQTKTGSQNDGWGVLAMAGAKLQLDQAWLDANHTAAVAAVGFGTSVGIARIKLSDTLADSAGQTGFGLDVEDGATASVETAWLDSNHGAGITVTGSGSSATVSNAWINNTLGRSSDKTAGSGASVSSGGQLACSNLRLSANHYAGLYLDGPGSNVTGTNVVVQAMQPQTSDNKGGFCLLADAGATANLTASRLSQCQTVGIYVAGTGTSVAMHSSTVDAVTSQAADGWGGPCMAATDQGSIEVDGVRLHQCTGVGAIASQLGTVQGHDLTIDQLQPYAADPTSSAGLAFDLGGQGTLHNMRIDQVAGAGIRVQGIDNSDKNGSGKPSLLAMSGVAIRNVVSSGGSPGSGLVVSGGGHATVAALSIWQAAGAGVVVHGAGSQLTQGQAPANWNEPWLGLQAALCGGRGLAVQDGASATLSDAFLWQNQQAGVTLTDPASRLDIDRLLVALPHGTGIEVSGGAQARIGTGVFQDCSGAALVISGASSRVDASDLAVDRVHPGANAQLGRSIEVMDSAQLHLAGARLSGHQLAALVVVDAIATVDGVLFQAPDPAQPENSAGLGIVVGSGALATLRGSRVEDQRGAAAYVAKGQLTASQSIFVNTTALSTGVPPMGDGVSAFQATALTLHQVWISGCPRAGLAIAGGTALVTQTLVKENLFALLLLAGAQLSESANLWLSQQTVPPAKIDLALPDIPNPLYPLPSLVPPL